MAIDFPNSPTAGDLYTAGGKTWQWNSTYWSAYGTSPVLRASDAPPSSPNANDLWYETDTGRLFAYVGTVWVEVGNAVDIAGALQPGQVTALSAVTTLTSDDVFPVVDNPASAVASSKITYGNLVTNMSTSLAPGLVLINTTTIGSAVSTVPVANAFSSTYDNYLVQISNTVVSANQPNLGIQMTGTTSGYNYAGLYNSYSNSTVTGDVTTVGTYFNVGACGNGTTGNGRVSMEVSVRSPNLAAATFFSASNPSLAWNSVYNGALNNSTQYTGLTILPSSGTLTGGTVRVYGYRNS
jgi:hypothetical protein